MDVIPGLLALEDGPLKPIPPVEAALREAGGRAVVSSTEVGCARARAAAV